MSRLKAVVLGLVTLGTLAAFAPSADAQVVIAVGHRHHHRYYRHHHHYYRHY